MRKALLALMFAAAGSLASAGPASERVFSTSALDLIEIDKTAVYAHSRQGELAASLKAVENGEIRILLPTGDDGKREAVVTMGEVGKLRPVSVWPASSGNPILPIFLESVLRSMARVTGGSAFYIRNRIKESLGTGGTITDVELDVAGKMMPVQHIMFEPFKNDKNSDRMGGFATLKLHFFVSDAMPGDIVRFVATTAGTEGEAAFREEISFTQVVGAE